MPDRATVDRQNRMHALSLAVEIHAADRPTADVLPTATQYLEWLRRPFPAATLTLRTGTPTPK